MGWSKLPVTAGAEIKVEAMDELRAAIVERRRAVGLGATAGLGDPSGVAAGDVCYAATVNAYRQRVEDLFTRYVRTDGSGEAWTKGAMMAEAFGAGRGDWTRVPERAGAAVYASDLAAGDVIYAEHVNEMKEVIDLLYLVPLDEKAGREYATSDGSAWQWAAVDPDVTRTFGANGNHQTPSAAEHAESAPFDLASEPIGEVSVVEVRARGRLLGTNDDKRVKLIVFVGGSDEDPQPTDRNWKAQIRLSGARPADSPRGQDTTVLIENNLADDSSHTADGKSEGHSSLEVYVDDYWGPQALPGLPAPEVWPFWLTFVSEDYAPIVAAYATEADATGRELQIWRAEAAYTIQKAWAKLDFEYLA